MRARALALLLSLIIASSAAAAPKRRALSPDRCSTIVAPASLSFSAAGGHAIVNVTVAGGCGWSPVASDTWIAAAPAGNQLSIDVTANTATVSRDGLVHVRGAVVVVTQEANSNLLTNGGFDSNVNSWSNAHSAGGAATWGTPSIVVAPPGPSPGAVMITSTDPLKGYQLSQCVAVTGGKTYEMGTEVLIPPGQPYGVVNFAAYEYWIPNCDSTPGISYHQHTVLSASTPAGTWFDLTITHPTDFNTKSILVVIGAGGSPTPPFSAWFDDVYLHEKP